jgi:hypothetical protein
MATRGKEKAPDVEASEAKKATRRKPSTELKKQKQSVITQHRHALLANCYWPIPIIAGKKRPVLNDWTNVVATTDLINEWERAGDNAGTGILTRTTPAIDVDILDEVVADDLEAFTRSYFNGAGRLLRRVGQWPKRAFLFRTETPFPKMLEKFIAPGRKFLDEDGSEHEHKLEILCDGQQLVGDGIHPDIHKPYAWNDHAPWEVPAAELVLLTREAARKWLDEATALLVKRGWQHVGVSQTTDHDANDSEPQIVQIAVRLWGSYYRTNVQGEYRFGTHGSKSVDALSRTWFDFEANMGGGLRDLIRLASSSGKEEEIKLVAEPHNFPDETTLPLWDFLYGRHLLRRTVAGTAAMSGTGKSGMAIAEALAMTTGKPLLGEEVSRPLRVLLVNLEDNRDAMNKRVAAAMKQYQLKPADVGGRLFIKAKGELKLKIAKRAARNGSVERNEAMIQGLVNFIVENKIDVVSVDPLIKTHGVNENDSEAMAAVVECYDDVAERANCAIHLWHHTRKSGGGEVTVESARGALAFVDACRSVRVLETMTKAEAEKLKLKTGAFHFREFSGKRNFAPPADQSTWYELVSVTLNNGVGEDAMVVDDRLLGDAVGVVTAWAHPGAKQVELHPYHIGEIKKVVGANEWRDDIRAAMWVGKAVAQVLGLSPVDDASVLKRLVEKLIANGALKRKPGKTRERKDAVFVVPADDVKHAAVLTAWKSTIGVGERRSLDHVLSNPGLHAALLAVAAMEDGKTISNVLLARWLRDFNEVPVDGFMLSGGGVDVTGSPLWAVVAVG